MRPDRLAVPASSPRAGIQARRTIGDARPRGNPGFARVSVNLRARQIAPLA